MVSETPGTGRKLETSVPTKDGCHNAKDRFQREHLCTAVNIAGESADIVIGDTQEPMTDHQSPGVPGHDDSTGRGSSGESTD